VLGIVLDTDRWAPPPRQSRAPGRTSGLPASDSHTSGVAAMLGSHGWFATSAGPEDSVTAVWQRLGALMNHGSGARGAVTATGMQQ